MSERQADRGDVRELFGVGAGELWRLLVAALGGPVAWSLHLGLCYFFVTLECISGWRGSDLAVAVATVLLALASAASGLLAYRMLRRRRPAEGWAAALGESRGQRELLLVVGMLFAALSVLAIIYAGVAPLFVPTCP